MAAARLDTLMLEARSYVPENALQKQNLFRRWQLSNTRANQRQRQNVVRLCIKKFLTRIALILYTRWFARWTSCAREEQTSMLMSRINKEHSMKWQPCAAMYPVVCSLGLTLSATNIFGGRLGQETSIDSRRIRQ